MKILFATKNKGKLVEIKKILHPIDVLSMEEAGIHVDVVEDGETFEENAVKKAKEIMGKTGQIVLADDSGLEIDFMDRQPGVHSARYLGTDTPYDIKNEKILALLKDVPEEKRTARFVCVIAAAFPDGKILTTRGVIEGQIGYEAAGGNGFGYDPIFYLPALKKTLAQVSLDEKNAISHRGQALAKMKVQLSEMMEKDL